MNSVQNLSAWKAKLESILQSSDKPSSEIIAEIRNLGVEMGPHNAKTLLKSRPDFFAYRAKLQQSYHDYIIRNERLQTQKLLREEWDGVTPFIDLTNPHSWRNYSRSIDMFDHIDFSNCMKMVLVGSGWMPATLFHVQDKTDVPTLIGIDIVLDAVESSNRLAKRYGYERVTTELHDGCSYDYNRADVIYVVGMVSSKPAILSRIADTAPENVQVIVSEPYSLAVLWEDQIEPSLDPRLEVVGRGKDWYASRTPLTGKGLGSAALSRDLYLRRRIAP